MFLLISQKDNILRYLPSDETNLGLNLKQAYPDVAMARFNLFTNTVFWLERKLGQIRYLSPQNKISKLNLCKPNAKPISFTIDFLSNTLYWTDKSDSSISFVRLIPPTTSDGDSKMTQTQCGVVFQHEDFHPTKITAFPERG